MRSSGILAILSTALLSSAAAKDAPVVSGNPQGIEYKATLPKHPFYSDAALVGNVKGYVSAVAAPGGKGVKFTIQFENFPKKGGPFMYHIHEMPATNGNCTSTLAHLDPYHRGETPACDASKPETCQVGDLSGKYGKITSDPYLAEYFDLYTSLQPGDPAFFGNRSIVVHYANKTRLTCANFAKLPVPGNITKLAPTATKSRTATKAPVATGGAHNITGAHNATGPHHATDALTPTGVVTAPGSSTTLESFTTVPARGSVSASATSSIAPFPGAASGNKVSISLLSGVVAAMFFSL
ncbi:cu,zn superoxide dismutase [Trichoderma arundinaceum]|uniref:superoxide dismutase n=1 Tax=Trichoderma arundinaceum TaxID=490622 RepID=A0A395NPT6_TRIAR|nr:cu,zn superoxide dismutase [Trichoderma arundinaceum]